MTIEKVKAIAKEKYGKDLTDEQASAYMEKHGKLSDDELNSIAGGMEVCGDNTPCECPNCGGTDISPHTNIYVCNECGCKLR